MIDSAVLERSITDPVLSFRLLGFSADIRVENSHVFLITANTPHVGRDLITRSIPINLWYEGDPAKRAFELADPESYAHEHRHELIAELLGMIERWKATGMTLADIGNRFNKRGWAGIVGGILDATGEPDFLANVDESAHSFDRQRQEIGELVCAMMNEPDRYWRTGELVSLAETTGLLGDDLGDGSHRSKTTRMGIVLSRYVRETFDIGNDTCATLNYRTDQHAKTYRAEVIT
jgi:hypothetical protein